MRNRIWLARGRVLTWLLVGSSIGCGDSSERPDDRSGSKSGHRVETDADSLPRWVSATMRAAADFRRAKAAADEAGNALLAQDAHDRLETIRTSKGTGARIATSTMEIDSIGRLTSAMIERIQGTDASAELSRAVSGHVLQLPRGASIDISLIMPAGADGEGLGHVGLKELRKGQVLRFSGTIVDGADLDALMESVYRTIGADELLGEFSTTLVVRTDKVELVQLKPGEYAKRQAVFGLLRESLVEAARKISALADLLVECRRQAPWKGDRAPFGDDDLRERHSVLTAPVRWLAQAVGDPIPAIPPPAEAASWVQAFVERADDPDLLAPTASLDALLTHVASMTVGTAQATAAGERLARWLASGGVPGTYDQILEREKALAGEYVLDTGSVGLSLGGAPIWQLRGGSASIIPREHDSLAIPQAWEFDDGAWRGRKSARGLTGSLSIAGSRTFTIRFDYDSRHATGEDFGAGRMGSGDRWRRIVTGTWTTQYHDRDLSIRLTPLKAEADGEMAPSYKQSNSAFDAAKRTIVSLDVKFDPASGRVARLGPDQEGWELGFLPRK
jgi:hypothetical protein